MDEIRKIPPVTRSIIGGVIAVTLPCLLQLLSPYKIFYVQKLVFGKFEIWRLFTSFLFAGGGLPMLFDTFMMFRGLNDLEESHFARRTADYAWALIIMCTSIIAVNYPLRTMIFFRPLLLAVTHLWAQTNPANRVSLFGLINLPAPYFPFALVLLDLVQGGPGMAMQSGTGIVAAHLYYFLAIIYPRQNGGRPLSFMSTPQFLIQQLGNGEQGGQYQAGGGWGFRPAAARGNRLGATPGSGGGIRAGAATPSSAAGRASTTTTATGTNMSAADAVRHRWGSGQRLGE